MFIFDCRYIVCSLLVLLGLDAFSQDVDSISANQARAQDSLAQPHIKSAVADTIWSIDAKRNAFTKELRFTQYLITQELYTDADYLLEDLIYQAVNQDQHDSAVFYKAWLSYFRQNFVESLNALYDIDSSSVLNTEASFLMATCYLHEGQYDQSEAIFNQLDGLTEKERAVKNLNLAGLALLTRDYTKYDSIIKRIPETNFMVGSELSSLNTYKTDMVTYKRKSPWLAGFLSALIPGLGKFYVGYRGTPFGALTLNLPLAAVAVETLIISGWTGIPFLITAPLFGVFYIGNIWGSGLSPYAHEQEFYDEMDHNILYDLHIPTRRVF